MGGCTSKVCRGTSPEPETPALGPRPAQQEKVPQSSPRTSKTPPRPVVAYDPEAHMVQIEKQLATIPDPGNHPDTAKLLDKLTTLYIQRYEASGSLEDLEKVILKLEHAISIVKDQATQSVFCNNLARTLIYRYQALGHDDDLKAAISRVEQAVELMPEDNPLRSMMLSNLATFLSYRYEQTQDLNLLNYVISKGNQAVDASPEGSHQRAERLQNLAGYFFFRFQRLGNVSDLQEAIAKTEMSLAPTPHGHYPRPPGLMNLSNFLLERFVLSQDAEDLEKAIASVEEAINNTPEGHAERAGMLSNYGTKLLTRSEVCDNTNDLNDAISKCREAVEATRSGHVLEHRAMLGNLAQTYSARFERTGNMEDLDAAMLHTGRAMHSTREDKVYWAAGLANLARLLCSRYMRTGDLSSLEESISKAEEAVLATGENHPQLPFQKCNLAGILFERYKTTGDPVDLDQAIALVQQAESVRVSLGLPEDTVLLSQHGLFLAEQYQRTGNQDELETAILKTERAIQITTGHSHHRAAWLNSLANMYASRYSRTGDDNDLDLAISNARKAVGARPKTHPGQAGLQANLALLLLRRYQLKGRRDDLAEAVSSAERSVRFTPDDSPDRIGWANKLGSAYWRQHKDTKRTAFLDAALKCFLEASQDSTSPPLHRITGARRAMQILHQRKAISRAAAVARDAIRLLPRVCSGSLGYDDQQFAASQTSGLAADACSILIQANMVDEALQAIEFGRGLTLGYLLDSRSDMSELKHLHPSVAESYQKLQSKAFSQGDTKSPAPPSRYFAERREDLRRLEEFENHLRSISGFEKFLLPPPVEELKACAAEGPLVVVNITDLGSHAIIVSTSGIKAVPLPDATSRPPPAFTASLTRHEVGRERYDQDFECETPKYGTDLLSWLWKTCVKPIIEALPEHGVETPRVWWIGTGAASSLPFHAAGLYDHDGDTPDTRSLDNCLDRVIPSYTPSIRALKHSRESASRIRGTDARNLSALIVAMPTTPGLRPLPGVLLEQDAVRETIGGALRVKELTGPAAQEVLSALPSANIVHFACHGVSHRNPSESHLFLQKSGQSGLALDKLTVSAILEASPQGKGWIANVSACSTTEVKAKSTAEEDIQIASVFQVAGFAHVIGSLWPASDDIRVGVAKLFYRSLLDNGEARDRNRAVAEALRYALLQIRKEYPDEPEHWALYTHSGA